MRKRSSSPPPDDENVAAFEAVSRLTDDGKNAAAVALGRLGGQKGGKARAKALSARRRAEIARDAANTRWRGNKAK